MNVNIQTVKFDADKRLVEFVEHKLAKMDRFAERSTGADVVLKLDKDFDKGESVDVVVRPEDVDIVPVEKGMLKGVVTSVDFLGVHYEIIVDIGGFKWMIQTTDECFVGDNVGLYIEPDAIHIMKTSEYSGLYGDYSTYSEEMEHLSDITEDDDE